MYRPPTFRDKAICQLDWSECTAWRLLLPFVIKSNVPSCPTQGRRWEGKLLQGWYQQLYLSRCWTRLRLYCTLKVKKKLAILKPWAHTCLCMFKRKRGQCWATLGRTEWLINHFHPNKKSLDSFKCMSPPKKLDLFKCMSCLSLTRVKSLSPAVVFPLLGLGGGSWATKERKEMENILPNQQRATGKTEAQAIDFFFKYKFGRFHMIHYIPRDG